MSLRQDIEIHQGEYVLIPLTVYTDEAKTAFKSLGGASVDYRIGTTDSTVLRITGAPNVAGSFASVTDPANGGALITLREADTAALEPRRYMHQVIVTDSGGKTNVVTDGFLTVHETLAV